MTQKAAADVDRSPAPARQRRDRRLLIAGMGAAAALTLANAALTLAQLAVHQVRCTPNVQDDDCIWGLVSSLSPLLPTAIGLALILVAPRAGTRWPSIAGFAVLGLTTIVYGSFVFG